MRVFHVSTGLARGGAELALFNLLKTTRDERNIQHCVICLGARGEISKMIEELGIPLTHLNVKSNPMRLLDLTGLIKKYNPNIIHTWMYHADLIGGLSARLSGFKKIIWSIHNSSPYDLPKFSSSRAVSFISACLSNYIPERIVAPSQHAIDSHISYGYCDSKFVSIPLGISFNRFKFKKKYRDNFREQHAIPSSAIVIGMAARYHRQKNFDLFFEMARYLVDFDPEVRFVLAGTNVVNENYEITRLIGRLGLDGNCILLGEMDDINTMLSSLDLYVSTSRGESFSLSLLEALATGIPCVAYKDADPMGFIGDFGKTVAHLDAMEFSTAIRQIITSGLSPSSSQAKLKIRELKVNYSMQAMSNSYLNLYRTVACNSK